MKRTDGLLLAGLALMWGSSFLLIRVAVPGFGPAALVALRVLLGAGLLFVYARAVRQPLALKQHARQFVVLGLLNAALPYMLISAAELHLTASFAAVLNATTPLFAAVFASFWLSERMTMRRVLGLMAGMMGVGLLVGWSPVPMSPVTLISVLAMLVASASYAAAGIYAKSSMNGVSVHSLAFGQQLGALVWLTIPGIVWAPATTPPTMAVWAVIALGLLSTGVAYLLYFRLLERVGPTRTSTITYLMPVVGVMWGVLLLDEPVNAGMFAGLGVVLASMVLVNDIRIRVPALRAADATCAAEGQ